MSGPGASTAPRWPGPHGPAAWQPGHPAWRGGARGLARGQPASPVPGLRRRPWLPKRGLALALRNRQISDFPLCNKSFNLSYCGHDL